MAKFQNLTKVDIITGSDTNLTDNKSSGDIYKLWGDDTGTTIVGGVYNTSFKSRKEQSKLVASVDESFSTKVHGGITNIDIV